MKYAQAGTLAYKRTKMKSFNFKLNDIRKDLDDILSRLKKKEKVNIFFGCYEDSPDTADHIGIVSIKNDTYFLHVKGWGIASKTFSYPTVQKTINAILQINKTFNLTDKIHINKNS